MWVYVDFYSFSASYAVKLLSFGLFQIVMFYTEAQGLFMTIHLIMKKKIEMWGVI